MTDDQLPDSPGAYVIHFDAPLGHARNYLGSGQDIRARIAQHRAGNGARIIAALGRAGTGWHVARFWPAATEAEARLIENALKNRRDSPRYCPDCTPGTTRAGNPEPAARRTARRHPPVRKNP